MAAEKQTVLIVPRMMAGVRAWATARLECQQLGSLTRTTLGVLCGGPIVWWLPDGQLLDERPTDPHLRYFAMPMRAVRNTWEPGFEGLD